MKKRIAHYFKTYPESEKCFVTSSEQMFHFEHDAKAHADTLTDKRVMECKREDFPEQQEEEEEEEEVGATKEKSDKRSRPAGKGVKLPEVKEPKEVVEPKADKKAVKEFTPAGEDEHTGKDLK